MKFNLYMYLNRVNDMMYDTCTLKIKINVNNTIAMTTIQNGNATLSRIIGNIFSSLWQSVGRERLLGATSVI